MSRGPHYEKAAYVGRITAQAMGETGTGKPQFVLRFLVLGRVNPLDPQGELLACEQYERTMYRVITDKTIEYLTEDLEKLGFQGESFKDLDPASPTCHSFVGSEHEFYCNHEANQEGGLREKWGLARGASALEVKALEPKAVRQLDTLFGKNLKAIKKAAAKPTPAQAAMVNELLQSAAAANDGPGDDLPF